MFTKLTNLLFIIISIQGFSQPQWSAEESEILHLISKDSSSKTSIYFPHKYSFGLKWKGYSYVILTKSGSDICLLPAGTHQVYRLKNSKDILQLNRIDSSDYEGDNFNCMAMIHRDTLFQYGGYGFWKNRDFFTRFIPFSGDWEFIQGGNALENALVMNYLQTKTNNFYTLGNFEQNSFKDLNPVFHDSIYRYNFNTRNWNILGSIIPKFLKNYRTEINGLTWSTDFGLGLVLPNNQFYLLDFSGNRLLKFRKSVEDSMIALRNICTREIANGTSLWLFLNDSLYHFAGNNTGFKSAAMYLDSTMLDLDTSSPLYTPVPTTGKTVDSALLKKDWTLAIVIFLLAGLIVFLISIKRRKSPPNEKEIILPVILTPKQETLPHVDLEKFFVKLDPVERGLLKELIMYSMQDKKMPTNIINKLLGVSGKDPEVQKSRRSTIITGINNLYTESTHNPGILIDRERDPFDKRAYLYFISEAKAGPLALFLNEPT